MSYDLRPRLTYEPRLRVIMEKIDRLGLLAGEGELPIIFADEARKKGIKIIAIAAKGIASPELDDHVEKIYWLELQEVDKLPFIFLTNKISRLVMLGKVPKSIFFKKDFSKSKEINSLLRDTRDLADDSLLRELSKKVERFGVSFVSPADFLADFMTKKKTYTKREPTTIEWEDIEFGKKICRTLGELDIGQTVVVKNKAILSVEAIEGSDEAIKRAGQFSNGSAVVVKMMKPNQDTRFDIPTVGIETIDSLIKAKASLLAMEAEKTFFINREESILKADENSISIVGI